MTIFNTLLQQFPLLFVHKQNQFHFNQCHFEKKNRLRKNNREKGLHKSTAINFIEEKCWYMIQKLTAISRFIKDNSIKASHELPSSLRQRYRVLSFNPYPAECLKLTCPPFILFLELFFINFGDIKVRILSFPANSIESMVRLHGCADWPGSILVSGKD